MLLARTAVPSALTILRIRLEIDFQFPALYCRSGYMSPLLMIDARLTDVRLHSHALEVQLADASIAGRSPRRASARSWDLHSTLEDCARSARVTSPLRNVGDVPRFCTRIRSDFVPLGSKTYS